PDFPAEGERMAASQPAQRIVPNHCGVAAPLRFQLRSSEGHGSAHEDVGYSNADRSAIGKRDIVVRRVKSCGSEKQVDAIESEACSVRDRGTENVIFANS